MKTILLATYVCSDCAMNADRHHNFSINVLNFSTVAKAGVTILLLIIIIWPKPANGYFLLFNIINFGLWVFCFCLYIYIYIFIIIAICY